MNQVHHIELESKQREISERLKKQKEKYIKKIEMISKQF